MVLEGRLTYQDDGMTTAVRAMTATVFQMQIHAENFAHFGMPGYQRKEPVVTSFVEYLGANAIDESRSTEIGRIRKSGNPLDFALNTLGYFQKLQADGTIQLTRDGRMKLDKEGNLLSLDSRPILSESGTPIKLPFLPIDMKRDLVVASDGEIKLFNPQTGETVSVNRISVANQDGTVARNIDMRQGHVEDSNVYLQQEFVRIVPLRRQFEANRQLFILQSDLLSRTIQELGRAQ